jgi:hypothetical protein
MASAQEYAQWIVDNQDKQGTDDFNTVAKAYEMAKASEANEGNTQTPPSAINYAAGPAVNTATGAVKPLITGAATENARDALNIVKNVTGWTPNQAMEAISHPINTTKAYIAGHPWANTPIRNIAGSVGKNVAGAVVQGATAPENLLSAPYGMAAYEQAKIRSNPNAPGLENNPYAQTIRGEYNTQGQAGAANQRSAISNMNTAGNPQPGTPQFSALQQQYAPAQPAVQHSVPATSTLAPPTSMNFIGRMHQLYDQYAPARTHNLGSQ